tara:strand:+ start:2214 stop:3680 length:1467 start_codon:yes stop_codon:yes gene_type:complete
MKLIQQYKILFFLLSLILFNGCKKDKDSALRIDSDDNAVNLSGDLQISDFVWQGLNYFYYWQESVVKLSDSLLNDSEKYTEFINENPNPKEFFESLKHPDDRFSWIQEDYQELDNYLKGVFSSNGVEFQLICYSSCDQIIGVVKYILEDSDASEKNIKRGDYFYGVDGISLTSKNYSNLLNGDNLSYTLNMATIENDGTLKPNDINIELVKEENFESNPIQVEKIISLNSNKIGYLMYNQFVGNKTSLINDSFGKFKNEGITDLIIDLRYNGGGSVATCTAIASMITGQFKGKVFSKQNWNSKLTEYWNDKNPESLNDLFDDKFDDSKQINSLNLEKVYIITTSESASSSELLINGLKPYINVIHIGELTSGKNVGSITVYDYIDNDGTKNPYHKYAMQPIVLKMANSDGFDDYTDGLIPDIEQEEDLFNLGTLGDPEEVLISIAINLITGSAKKSYKKVQMKKENLIKDPKIKKKQIMHVDFNPISK